MKKIIVLFLLAVTIVANAQNSEKNFIDQNYIEVTGKAEMSVVPDQIYLRIILSEKDIKNNQPLSELESKMKNKLQGLGIDLSKDLSVKDYVSSYKSAFLSKNIVLSKEYQLIVHDTKALQSVFVELQKLDISNVTINRLDHSTMAQFRKEVKINAIKAAKEKAASLAQSVGQTIGRAIYIQELDVDQPFGNLLEGRMARFSANSVASGSEESLPESDFKKIELTSSILVRFELK